MSNPPNPPTSVMHAEQRLLDIPATIRAVQKTLANADKEPSAPKYKEVLRRVAKGPFLVQAKSFTRHREQRNPKENPGHVKKLQIILAGSDRRMSNQILAFIPTDVWMALQAPENAPERLEDLKAWSLAGAPGELLTFTHGHRLYALDAALTAVEGTPDAKYTKAIKKTYTDDPKWPAMLLPQSLLDAMPDTLIQSLILEDNFRDQAHLPLNAGLSHVAFILAYFHKYNYLYLKDDGSYRQELLNVTGIQAHLKGQYAYSTKASYDKGLAHPEALRVLVNSSKMLPSLLEEHAKLDRFYGHGIWPAVVGLDVGIHQLQSLSHHHGQLALHLVSRTDEEGMQLYEKQGVMMNFKFLEQRATAKYVFSGIEQGKPWPEREAAMDRVVQSMKTWDASYPQRLQNVLGQGKGSEVRLMHKDKEPQFLIWLKYFSSQNADPLHTAFTELMSVVQLLIYILMGPKAANRVYDAMPRGGAIEFGRFPWWRSPDSVLLVFLSLVRKGKTSPGEPLKVPVDLQCVGWVYANAHAEDLVTLDKIAGYLLCHWDLLVDQKFDSLCHRRASNGKDFDWTPGERDTTCGSLYRFVSRAEGEKGSDELCPPSKVRGKAKLTLSVYCGTSAPKQYSEQQESNFKLALVNLVNVSLWEDLLRKVIGIEQLVVPGLEGVYLELIESWKARDEQPPPGTSSSTVKDKSNPSQTERIETPEPAPNQQAKAAKSKSAGKQKQSSKAPARADRPTTRSQAQEQPSIETLPEEVTPPRPTQGGKGPAAFAALVAQKRKRTDGESSDDSKTSDEEAEKEESLVRRKAKQRKQLEGTAGEEREPVFRNLDEELLFAAGHQDPAGSRGMQHPLHDTHLPPNAPDASQMQPAWFEASDAEREAIVKVSEGAFHQGASPYIQAGKYQVLRLFEGVAQSYGEDKEKWDLAFSDLQQFVDKQREKMAEGAKEKEGGSQE